ncbi:MAG TPA: fumarylacetoacetate hydrolase family protein [Balneolaceae bacterium]
MAKKLPGLEHLEIGTIFCIGRNYVEHARELNNEVPGEPIVFLKPSSSVIFDGETITLPPQSGSIHHEVEMVVAIGKGGKHITENQALNHVAGYAVGIDVTARDIQQKAKEKGHPWSIAKGFDTFAPLSTSVTADKVADPQNIDLQISVNGEKRQHDNTRLMIFPIAKLISFLSGIFTLHPGDLIFTGTPKGVSAIKSGDKIEAILGNSLTKLNVTVE